MRGLYHKNRHRPDFQCRRKQPYRDALYLSCNRLGCRHYRQLILGWVPESNPFRAHRHGRLSLLDTIFLPYDLWMVFANDKPSTFSAINNGLQKRSEEEKREIRLNSLKQQAAEGDPVAQYNLRRRSSRKSAKRGKSYLVQKQPSK